MKYLLMLCLLTGCATGYRAKNFNGGYSQTHYGNDKYIVSYMGNKYTSFDDIREMAFRRIKEICNSTGFNGWYIYDIENDEVNNFIKITMQCRKL